MTIIEQNALNAIIRMAKILEEISESLKEINKKLDKAETKEG